MGKKKGGGVRVKQVGPKLGAGLNPAAMLNPMEAFMNDPAAQQIKLPPQPNRKYQMFWPLSESFSMKTEGFQVIYPSYLDATKTSAKGRRIGLEKAVAAPTVSDVSAALQQLQVRHVLQPYKGYSPDCICQWDSPGRCLVDVSNYKKRELLLELAKRIPDIPSRVARLEREAQEREKTEKEAAARALEDAKSAPKASKSVAIGSTKKKGKKSTKKK